MFIRLGAVFYFIDPENAGHMLVNGGSEAKLFVSIASGYLPDPTLLPF